MNRMTILLSAGLCLAPLAVAGQTPQPISDFVKHPTYGTAKISPDGRYLAITVDRGDQDVLTVLRTGDLAPVKVNILPEGKSVGEFHWVGPERLMFNAVMKLGGFAQPRATGEWFATNADGSMSRALIEYGSRNVTQRGKATGNARYELLDTLRDDDEHVIMQAVSARSAEGVNSEVFRLNVFNARRVSLGRAPRENCSMVLGKDKLPAFAVCSDTEDEEAGFDIHSEVYRRDQAGKWHLLNSSKESGSRLDVLHTSADGNIYASMDRTGAPAAFGTLDAASGEFTPLFRDEVSDVSAYITAVDGSERVIGVATEAGAPKVTLLDENHPDAELYASLAAAFPGQFVNFSNATADGRQVIVGVYSDRNPGELYLFDRDTGKARFLLNRRPWIDRDTLGTMRSIAFTARDGRTIHGYLTIPHGSDGRNLPLIVNVHGGPIGPRDNWGYGTEPQMFASRGYATLQINYRGSGGFGKAFEDLGYGTWATGIMDDIIDGTNHVIEQGWADRERVCIYGGSFGGYAAMMAPVRAPDLFKCAFGYVGMYDAQIQLTRSDTSYSEGGRRYMMRAFGSTRAEQNAMSPVNFADRIKLPVYLAAGARDRRCPPEHTEAMARALTAAGNPPEGVIIESGEEHGFYEEENNLRLYTEMLAFFDRHIGRTGQAADVAVGTP